MEEKLKNLFKWARNATCASKIDIIIDSDFYCRLEMMRLPGSDWEDLCEANWDDFAAMDEVKFKEYLVKENPESIYSPFLVGKFYTVSMIESECDKHEYTFARLSSNIISCSYIHSEEMDTILFKMEKKEPSYKCIYKSY